MIASDENINIVSYGDVKADNRDVEIVADESQDTATPRKAELKWEGIVIFCDANIMLIFIAIVNIEKKN